MKISHENIRLFHKEVLRLPDWRRRSAEVMESLNHPNIAAIYGVEQGALEMELV